MASAEIQHNRNLVYSNALRAEAQVDRLLASARANREHSEAFADADDAAARAELTIALAEASAHRQIASAREDAVKALFGARVVQVDSDRVRHMTEQYRENFHRNTNLETVIAQAAAARQASQLRLAELQKQQQQLRETALQDWDIRLAGLKYYQPQNDATAVTNKTSTPAHSDPDVFDVQVADVPTNFQEP